MLRGDGVFETTLVVDGVPRDLDEHLARLAVSAGMADLGCPPAEAGGARSTRCWRSPALRRRWRCGWSPPAGRRPAAADLLRDARPVAAADPAQRDGVRVLLLDRGFAGPAAAKAPWLLAGAKTLSYAVNMAAQRYAKANDADDVIFVGSDGAVLEAPTATVVVAAVAPCTTPPRDGILDGITVRRLFAAAEQAGWTGASGAHPGDLGAADGVWLASSARLLAPVVAIDGVARPVGPQHAELARLLQMSRSLRRLGQLRLRRPQSWDPAHGVRVGAGALVPVQPGDVRPSASVSSKSKRSKFSRTRLRRHRLREHDVAALQVPAQRDLGRRPVGLSAIRTIVGSSSTLPCAIGDQASVAMPCSASKARTSSLAR